MTVVCDTLADMGQGAVAICQAIENHPAYFSGTICEAAAALTQALLGRPPRPDQYVGDFGPGAADGKGGDS